jgi:hypothetical protein
MKLSGVFVLATEAELEALRRSVARGSPFGKALWQKQRRSDYDCSPRYVCAVGRGQNNRYKDCRGRDAGCPAPPARIRT